MNKLSTTQDLATLIDKQSLECLNEDAAHPVSHALFDQSATKYLKSDADEQLVIQFKFTSNVKLQSIQVRYPHSYPAQLHSSQQCTPRDQGVLQPTALGF